MIERAPGPLFAFADATYAARARRHRIARSALAIALLASAIAATIALPPRPHLVWNASASAPVGLYGITTNSMIRHGSTVLAWAPPPMRRLAATRHYLPQNVPLIKRVAAVAGDRICAQGTTILINGGPVVIRQSRDPRGRSMPWWEGCRRLREGELFLLMDRSPLSFDGRYFGVTAREQVIGKAHLIWAR